MLSKTKIIPKDNEHRLLAAIPQEFNVIVEAGAGTGKTTLLIDRLCYLILGKTIAVDKIIALTFTDKAAAEIKVRLQSKMQIILAELKKVKTADDADEIEDETTKTLLKTFGRKREEIEADIQHYFDLLERAQISTIHSFCLNILRRYPLEAGLAPQAAVDEGAFQEKLFEAKWTAFLEEELGLDSKNKNFWQEFLADASLDDAKNFAWNIIKIEPSSYNPLNNAENIKRACAYYRQKALELCGIYEDTSSRSLLLPKLKLAADIFKETEEFLNNPSYKKSAYGEIGSKPSCPKNWGEKDFEEAELILNMAAAFNIDKQITIIKFFNIIRPFAEDFLADFKKYNLLTFNDIITKTGLLVKNNLAVREELKKEYKSILIDEFQDTDPAQGEILLFLAEEAATAKPAKNWRDIVPQSGKLFVVGDPKQTIYNFRGADINAYEEFTDLMLRHGAKKCFLQTNFRSSAQIIDFANTAGETLIKAERGVQPEYIPIDCGRNFSAPPVLLAAVDNEGGNAALTEAFRHNQAQFIAAWIKENAGKTKTADGSLLAFRDIAVLLRTTTALGIYTSALERFGIRYTVEADNNFYASQEVLDMLNILRVIYNPLDFAALAGVLRSPFGLIKDADILKLKEQGRFNIFAPQKDDIPNVKNVFNILKTLHNRAGKISLRKLLSVIIYETDFLEMQTISCAKEQAVANIFKLFDIVSQMGGRGVMTLGQFLFSVREFIGNQKKEGASPLTEESLDTVNIMTIHKAKGLEFKTVIIADISKQELQGRNSAQILLDWDKKIYGLKLGKAADFNYALLETGRKLHAKAEEARVLYVALTRAKERLVLAGDLGEDKNSIAASLQRAGLYPSPEEKEKKLKSNNFDLEVLPVSFKDTESFLNAEYNDESHKKIKMDINGWLESWAQRVEVFDKINSRKLFDAPSSKEADFAIDEAAVITGSISHKMMEGVFSQKQLTAKQAAAALGIKADAEILKNAQEIIDNFKSSKVYEFLNRYSLLAAELPFTVEKDGLTVNGIIDAVFETDEGLLIADYKTDNIQQPQKAQENSLKYQRQLDIYKEALGKIMPAKNIKAAVVYLRTVQIIYM